MRKCVFVIALVFLLTVSVLVARAELELGSLDPGLVQGIGSPAQLDKTAESLLGWRMVGQVGGRTEDVAVQGDYAYVAVGLRLVVLDVSEPITPTEVGSTAPFPQFVEGVAVSGALAYVADGIAGLRVVNVIDPSNPIEVGACDTPGYAEGVAVAGGYAYVADGHYGLRIVDVSDPTNPAEVAYAYPLNYVFDVAVVGQYTYLAAAGAGLLVVDIHDPADPIEIATYDTPGYAYGVDVADGVAYVADGWEDLRVVNVSDPANPVELASFETPGWAFDVDAEDDTLYVADAFAGLQVVDVSDPAHPVRLGAYGVAGGHAGQLVVVGETAYVADRNWGLRIVDVSDPGAPNQIGGYEPLGYATAVAVSGDYAYVAAATQGLRVVDISERANPAEVGTYAIQGNAIGVAVADNYAYVAVTCPDVGAGLHVIDVSDAETPVGVGYHPQVQGCYRDITTADGTAYVADEWGLELIDVSTPTTPTLLSHIELQGKEWGATTGVDVSGTLAYVAGDNGLYIVDVSDPVSPTCILEGYCDHCEGDLKDYDVAVSGTTAYITYHGGEALKIVDVTDPGHPTQLGAYWGPGLPERVTIVDNTALVAFGGAGLQAVDVTDPSNPTLSISYDTPGFAAASAVAGDYVFVADGDGGLLILEMRDSYFGESRPMTSRSAAVAGATRNRPGSGSMTTAVGATASGTRFATEDNREPVQPPPVPRFGRPSTPSPQATAATRVVTSTADSGPGTLRECLEQANAGDTITFDPAIFPPTAPATITLQSMLPGIGCGHLTIDGSDAGVVLDGSQLEEGTGLYISSDHNVIRGLQILRFPRSGVTIESGMGNTIGGDRTVGNGPLGQGNLLSGCEVGITMSGAEAMSNTVVGNYIGTDVSGLGALGNQGSGIQISDYASRNRIGGTLPGEGNLISANGYAGIHLVVHASRNAIVGNTIGTDVSGTVAMANGDDGVLIELSSGRNTIEGNLISGNDRGGVHISDQGSSYNVVVGNLIGTDANGTVTIGNASYGVAVGFGGANFNRIGGTSPEDRNVIGGGRAGIELHGREAGNLILGNLIGTNISGTQAISNTRGIFVVDDSSRNFIGGTTAAERNVISGNDSAGIDLMPAERVFILGNYIGTDASGTVTLANGECGIRSDGARYSVIQGNVVSGNEQAGVRLEDSSSFNHLRANRIGVAADGVSPLGNGMEGVTVWAESNTVGGPYPEDGNTIAFNGNVGVQVWTYPGNTIRRNSIYGNAYSGISLVEGGNDDLAAPVITYVLLDSVEGTACTGCIVEVFSDEEDEGQVYEGHTIADGSGNWTWAGRAGGPYVTATATDQTGNTSAFSVPQMAERHWIYLPLVARGND